MSWSSSNTTTLVCKRRSPKGKKKFEPAPSLTRSKPKRRCCSRTTAYSPCWSVLHGCVCHQGLIPCAWMSNKKAAKTKSIRGKRHVRMYCPCHDVESYPIECPANRKSALSTLNVIFWIVSPSPVPPITTIHSRMDNSLSFPDPLKDMVAIHRVQEMHLEE
jgi:hypothetical protein